MPLPRGALDLSVGATRDVADELQPSGSLSLTRETPRGTLTAALSQDVRTSDRSNELRTTRASLGYTHEINALSQIGLSASFAELSPAPAARRSTIPPAPICAPHTATRSPATGSSPRATNTASATRTPSAPQHPTASSSPSNASSH